MCEIQNRANECTRDLVEFRSYISTLFIIARFYLCQKLTSVSHFYALQTKWVSNSYLFHASCTGFCIF